MRTTVRRSASQPLTGVLAYHRGARQNVVRCRPALAAPHAPGPRPTSGHGSQLPLLNVTSINTILLRYYFPFSGSFPFSGGPGSRGRTTGSRWRTDRTGHGASRHGSRRMRTLSDCT